MVVNSYSGISSGYALFTKKKNQSSEKETHEFWGIIVCNPSIYTMGHADFIVCSFMGKSIGLKKGLSHDTTQSYCHSGAELVTDVLSGTSIKTTELRQDSSTSSVHVTVDRAQLTICILFSQHMRFWYYRICTKPSCRRPC